MPNLVIQKPILFVPDEISTYPDFSQNMDVEVVKTIDELQSMSLQGRTVIYGVHWSGSRFLTTSSYNSTYLQALIEKAAKVGTVAILHASKDNPYAPQLGITSSDLPHGIPISTWQYKDKQLHTYEAAIPVLDVKTNKIENFQIKPPQSTEQPVHTSEAPITEIAPKPKTKNTQSLSELIYLLCLKILSCCCFCCYKEETDILDDSPSHSAAAEQWKQV